MSPTAAPLKQSKSRKSEPNDLPSFGVDSNTEGGGVWKNTSSKTEKLLELKAEAPFKSDGSKMDLSDCVTSTQEILQLDIANGIKSIFHTAENVLDAHQKNSFNQYFRALLDEQVTSRFVPPPSSDGAPSDIDFFVVLDGARSTLEGCRDVLCNNIVFLHNENRKTSVKFDGVGDVLGHYVPLFENFTSEDGAEEGASSENGKDFADNVTIDDSVTGIKRATNDDVCVAGFNPLIPLSKEADSVSISPTVLATRIFLTSLVLHRVNMCISLLQVLSETYKAERGIRVSDLDLDRIALSESGDVMDADYYDNVLKNVEINEGYVKFDNEKLFKCLESMLMHDFESRIKAIWNFLDFDGDGSLEKDEMFRVAEIYDDSMNKAVDALSSQVIEGVKWDSGNTFVLSNRRNKKGKKLYSKIFKKSLKQCFEIEEEAPHRLRCIYAWSDKKSQGDETLVKYLSESNGKKRYIEFPPKISFDEFRSLQKEHFEGIENYGSTIAKSVYDSLLVKQGKGRQDRELMMQCAAFLTTVTVADYFAGIL